MVDGGKNLVVDGSGNLRIETSTVVRSALTATLGERCHHDWLVGTFRNVVVGFDEVFAADAQATTVTERIYRDSLTKRKSSSMDNREIES